MPREKAGKRGKSPTQASKSSIVKKAPAKKRTRTPDYAEYPDWSEAKFWSFVRSGLRAKWNRWPPKWEVLRDAKQGTSYKCAVCHEMFKQKEVQVDHIIPAGGLKNADEAGSFITRLFVGKDKLRVLCIDCHKQITKEQRDDRKESSSKIYDV